MAKIIIETHNCSREELEELKEYLSGKCWDFKVEHETSKVRPKYILGGNSINGIELTDKIIDDELHEYFVKNRSDMIDDLIGWIAENSQSKALMREDMEMLLCWDDEYILSSNSTNSYLRQGDSGFDEACKKLLELHEEHKDLFEYYEELPQKVQGILIDFADTRGHEEVAELRKKLEKHGYTCETCMSGEPINLKKI